MPLSTATARTLADMARGLHNALISTDLENSDLAHHATRRAVVEMLDHIDQIAAFVGPISDHVQTAGAVAAGLGDQAPADEPPADAALDIAAAADAREDGGS